MGCNTMGKTVRQCKKVFWDLPRKQCSERRKVTIASLSPHNQEVFPLCASVFNGDLR